MQRLRICAVLILGLFVFTCAALAGADRPAFVGAAACKMCHKAQFEIWVASKHAKAMETLKSEAAAKIAKEKGVAGSASESAVCRSCHGGVAKTTPVDAKFDANLGVQCETCHGPGADYKAMATMKDKAKALAAGLTPIAIADGTAEKRCVNCHNADSPTFKGFKFQESWDKIKHPKPAK